MERFVNAAQRYLLRYAWRAWEGDNRCYMCPLRRCENRREFLDQAPRLKEYPVWYWGDGSY